MNIAISSGGRAALECGLKHWHFPDPTEAEIWREVCRRASSNENVSLDSLMASGISGDAKTLAQKVLTFRADAGALPDICSEIERETLRCETHNMLRENFAQLQKDDCDPLSIADEIERGIGELRRRGTRATTLEGGDVDDLSDEIEWRSNNPGQPRGIRFGMPQTELVIDGLLPKLHLIGAAPSMGKTSLITSMLLGILRAGPETEPLVFSLEDEGKSVQAKLAANLAGIDLNKPKEEKFTKAEWKEISDAIGIMRTWKWRYSDTIFDIDDMVRGAREMHYQNRLHSVWIDYIQLVTCRRAGGGNRVQEIDEILATIVNDIIRPMNVPVIIASQLRKLNYTFNAEHEESTIREPTLDDIRDSSALKAAPRVIMFICGDQEIASKCNKMQLSVAKVSSGFPQKVSLIFDGELSRFTEY